MSLTDAQILTEIGLTDEELKAAQAKFSEFANSLNDRNKEAVKRSIPSAESAARTLSPDVTAERLSEFIRARAPRDSTILFFFNGISFHR